MSVRHVPGCMFTSVVRKLGSGAMRPCTGYLEQGQGSGVDLLPCRPGFCDPGSSPRAVRRW